MQKQKINTIPIVYIFSGPKVILYNTASTKIPYLFFFVTLYTPNRIIGSTINKRKKEFCAIQ